MQKDAPKPKAKGSPDGLSKFERAQQLFRDIESIIEQELANTPAIYEANIARVKKSKRKRPGLIKNFNSKKNRQGTIVIGGMEFDPETQTWLGNDEVLGAFSPQQPALIINRGKHDKAKVVGKMTWDPKEQKWKGNEKDAHKFSPRKPALITPLGSSSYLLKEVAGMVFDPTTMRWVGNDNAVDIFSQIDTLDDTGFTVGNEFQLSPSLTKSFIECANRHKATLSGWFSEEKPDRKSHLYSIRNMSILRVVRDVKQRRSFVDVEDELDADVPERDVPSPSPREKNSGNGKHDTADDYDDLPLPVTLKLPEVGVGTDDWDNDFDEEPTPPVSAKGERPSLAPLVQNLGKKVEVEEDWDDDFAETDADAFKNLKPSPLLTAKKPFQIELPKRGSVIDLQRERRNSHPPKPSKLAPAEEDEEGFELPPGPVRLVPSLKRTVDSDTPDDFDSSSSSSAPTNASEPKHDETEDDFEEEEEDWTDVDVPTTFPSAPVRKPHQDREDWDNDADIEITTSKLTLKQPTRTSDDEEAEQDLLDGVEIPEDFTARIRK